MNPCATACSQGVAQGKRLHCWFCWQYVHACCDRRAVLTMLQVPERLASWASRSTQLTAWLARFSSLRRPLDGAMPLADVLVAAGDVASGILTAKAAAQAARAASEAAEQARASAEKVSALMLSHWAEAALLSHKQIFSQMVQQPGCVPSGQSAGPLTTYYVPRMIDCCSVSFPTRGFCSIFCSATDYGYLHTVLIPYTGPGTVQAEPSTCRGSCKGPAGSQEG
jgi:hypothetical protein